MRSMNVSSGEMTPAAPTKPPTNLHEAAKRGDVEAATRMLDEDKTDINSEVNQDVHCGSSLA
jgi:hypothetical protein